MAKLFAKESWKENTVRSTIFLYYTGNANVQSLNVIGSMEPRTCDSNLNDMTDPTNEEVFFLHSEKKMTFSAAKMFCTETEGLQLASVLEWTAYTRTATYLKGELKNLKKLVIMKKYSIYSSTNDCKAI